MQEYIALFNRNFPFCVREESVVRELLYQEQSHIFEKRTSDGILIGAAVVEENNILMLCVDIEYRHRGVGSALLADAEEYIRAKGFTTITVGAGKHYLMPGIPSNTPIVSESLQPDAVYKNLDTDGVQFFQSHGYKHSWGCNCFDMRMDLHDFSAEPFVTEGVIYRIAEPFDMEGAAACTDDAHESFTQYYRDPQMYTGTGRKRVLVAEADGLIVGTLIISLESEGTGLGSVGCTAVRHAYQGRKIASNLVILGTKILRDSGMRQAFLGYTYTGLDKMYGFAGYKICVYYFMASKQL